jgi:hypothetical protein
MSETFYCPEQTFAGRMYDDPQPAEHCENEVDNEGDLCPQHDEDDRSDELYDRYLDEKAEREADLDNWTDNDPWGDD